VEKLKVLFSMGFLYQLKIIIHNIHNSGFERWLCVPNSLFVMVLEVFGKKKIGKIMYKGKSQKIQANFKIYNSCYNYALSIDFFFFFFGRYASGKWKIEITQLNVFN
jgi:hypothetical protein